MIEKLIPRRMRPEDKRFIALAVSAFVCPGAGQCMAGRWVIGIAFALGISTTVLSWCILLFWPLLSRLMSPLNEWISGEPLPAHPYEWRWILISFLCTCFIYCWNVFDAWLQVRR
ncbi:MAG: hypothetical protein NTY53_16715, partial [Kiritimatiellaeota bacterium]|nr:hypothetical protein [Kiritimatiellota bacterium]